MIVKLILEDSDGDRITLMTGTSYKNYLDQIQDFFYRGQKWIDSLPHPEYKIIKIETSKSKWKAWGGLKWCLEENFQDQLNREGCQTGDPNNPNPRQYSKMKFIKNYYVEQKIFDWYNQQYQQRIVQ